MTESLGRIRACSECRLQKLRCDAREDYSKPCSRCRKMGLSCEVSRGVKKSQRRTKAELARENAKLREQLQTDPASPSSTRSKVIESTQGVPLLPKRNESFSRTDLTIEQVGFDKINGCFSLFFEHYEPLIPGIFESQNPYEYYEQSPFLFWSIVATGARRFADDPTLFESVVRHIMDIALITLSSLSNPIPSIEAVLILCHWPPPINTMFKDPSHVLAGAAMQLAVQNGLHIFGHEQDFVRQSIETENSEVLFRSRLWVHCVTIFQSTSLCDGLPFWSIPSPSSFDYDIAYQLTLPPSLMYRYKLHKLQTDAVQAINQSTNLIVRDCGQPLNSLIDVFDAQARAISPDLNDSLQVLTHACVRLSIQAFYFFAAPDRSRTAGLVQLYNTACQVIDLSTILPDFAQNSPQFFNRMLILAAFTILKISRSELKEYVDLSAGQAAFYKTINFSKMRSAENNDLDARNGIILTQLWASNSIFKKKDGTLAGDQLRLRSRLFMSVIFDTFWYWRTTFGGWKTNPYAYDDDKELEPDLTDDPVIPPMQEPSFESQPIDFTAFPDWDWAAGLRLMDETEFPVPQFPISMPFC